MADIELVIKIPQEVYEEIKNGAVIELHCGEHIIIKDEWASKVIRNGTPLPKGHGRLIDVGQCDRKTFYQQCGGADSLITAKSAFDMLMSLPSIIEADKESKKPKQTLKSCKNCGYPHKLAGKCYSCDDYSQWIPIEADKEEINERV